MRSAMVGGNVDRTRRRLIDAFVPGRVGGARLCDSGHVVLVPVVGTNSDADQIAAAKRINDALGSGYGIRLLSLTSAARSCWRLRYERR